MRYVSTKNSAGGEGKNRLTMKMLIGYFSVFDQRFQSDRRSIAAFVRIDSVLKADEKSTAPFYAFTQEDWELLAQAADKPKPMANAETGERFPSYPCGVSAALGQMLDDIVNAPDVEPQEVANAEERKPTNGAGALAQ